MLNLSRLTKIALENWPEDKSINKSIIEQLINDEFDIRIYKRNKKYTRNELIIILEKDRIGITRSMKTKKYDLLCKELISMKGELERIMSEIPDGYHPNHREGIMEKQ